MTDGELLKRLRDPDEMTCADGMEAADRIEALTAERDELQQVFDFQWKANMRAVEMWRAANPGNDLVLPDSAKLAIWLLERIKALTEQRDEARRDAVEAEAYAEGLERDLKTCCMAQAVMDNTVAELEKQCEGLMQAGMNNGQALILAEAKLAKAVEALRGLMQHMPDYADTVWQDARETLAEVEGESHE
jgi:hypothetical protein